MRELRSYKVAFESKTVAQISELIDELEEVGKSRAGYKVYTSEIQGCLMGGLLLGAASVSYALLELFIRDLDVMYVIALNHGGDVKLRARVERELEADRKAGFAEMLKDLEQTVIEAADASRLRDFYDHTRVPLAHGLVRRLTKEFPDEFDDMFAKISRRGKLEQRIEGEAITDVKFVISMLKKYLPWLLRRYSGEDRS
jgi:predicted Rdx family selenoprotein